MFILILSKLGIWLIINSLANKKGKYAEDINDKI
jgi:hypothetical protein